MRSSCSLFSLFSTAPTRETLCATISSIFKEEIATLVRNRKARYGSLMREQRAQLIISNWGEFKTQLAKNIDNKFVDQCLAAHPDVRDELIKHYAKQLALQTGLHDLTIKDKIFINSTRIPSHRFQYFPTIYIHYTLPPAILNCEKSLKCV